MPPGAVALEFVDVAFRSPSLYGDRLDLRPVAVGQLERASRDVGGKMRARGRANNDRSDARKIERGAAALLCLIALAQSLRELPGVEAFIREHPRCAVSALSSTPCRPSVSSFGPRVGCGRCIASRHSLGLSEFRFALCLDKIPEASLEGLDLSSLRMVANGAEPVSAETLRRFIDRFGRYGFHAGGDGAGLRPRRMFGRARVPAARPAPDRR